MRETLTPKQVARAIGASEASLKRWCDKGLLPCLKTAGGHRRLPLNGVIQFLRETGQKIVRPEVLGLPSAVGTGEVVRHRAVRGVIDALEAGDEEQFRRLVLDLYLGGQTLVCICDTIIAPAFHSVGQHWEHGEIDVFHERRATEICLRVLLEARQLMLPREDGPVAIGGTIQGDHYSLPTMMVEIALREAGWQAQCYGTNVPLESWKAAVSIRRPRLIWLSLSHIQEPQQFMKQYHELYNVAVESGAAVAVGGRALNDEYRKLMRYSAFCDNLEHLVSFGETLQRQPRVA